MRIACPAHILHMRHSGILFFIYEKHKIVIERKDMQIRKKDFFCKNAQAKKNAQKKANGKSFHDKLL